MSDKGKIVTNSDNDWLEDFPFVDEVNGPGAEEIQGFVPTRDELIQIVNYWAEIELDVNFFMFIHDQVESHWLRESSFARHRIWRIAKILGEDEVRKAIDEVYAKFGKDLDKRTWNIFLHGTKAQRATLQEEVQQEMNESLKGEPK